MTRNSEGEKIIHIASWKWCKSEPGTALSSPADRCIYHGELRPGMGESGFPLGAGAKFSFVSITIKQ